MAMTFACGKCDFGTWILGTRELNFAYNTCVFFNISLLQNALLFEVTFEKCEKRDFEIMRFCLYVEQKMKIWEISRVGPNRKY